MAILKRKVFYISGFDPRGPAAYHKVYSEEAQKHFELKGGNVSVSERRNIGRVASWHISYNDGQRTTETDYDFLRWDDIIRKWWIKGPINFLLKSILFYIFIFSRKRWSKIFKVSSNVGITILYPLFVFFLITITGLFFGNGLSILAGSFYPQTIKYIIAATLIYLGLKLANKLSIFWLLRIYIFFQNQSYIENASINPRAKEFANHIISELRKNEYQEYLLVSHSVGTSVCVSVLAEIMKQCEPSIYAKLKIITLGQCTPVLTFISRKDFFREELKFISNHSWFWLDASSPSDGVCFALTSPFVAAAEPNNVNLKLISPRFHKMFSPDSYEKIKRNKFRTHFQYIMAGEFLTDYNYFDITAGNKPLEEVYGAL